MFTLSTVAFSKLLDATTECQLDLHLHLLHLLRVLGQLLCRVTAASAWVKRSGDEL
jgi:hypothetical protein